MKSRLSIALLLAAAALVVPAPSYAAACSSTTGVTVVVQFPDGHTESGCAPGNPSSGYHALNAAGFSTDLVTAGGGIGALCRIDGQPTNASCHSMPASNAYWAYFHAKRGGSWSYSNEGGGSYDPAPGSVEGWAFGAGTAPTTAPPAAVVSTPKPTPTKKPTATPTKAAAKPHATPTPTQTSTSTPGTTASATPTPTAKATPTGTSSPTPRSSASAGYTVVNRAAGMGEHDTPPPKNSGSGGLSWIWGVVLLAAVLAVAGVTALRRRRG